MKGPRTPERTGLSGCIDGWNAICEIHKHFVFMIDLSKGDNAVLATVFRCLPFQAPAIANCKEEDGLEAPYC